MLLSCFYDDHNLNTRLSLSLAWPLILTCTDGHRGAPLPLPALEGVAAQQTVARPAAQLPRPAPTVSGAADLAVLQSGNQAVLCNIIEVS